MTNTNTNKIENCHIPWPPLNSPGYPQTDKWPPTDWQPAPKDRHVDIERLKKQFIEMSNSESAKTSPPKIQSQASWKISRVIELLNFIKFQEETHAITSEDDIDDLAAYFAEVQDLLSDLHLEYFPSISTSDTPRPLDPPKSARPREVG